MTMGPKTSITDRKHFLIRPIITLALTSIVCFAPLSYVEGFAVLGRTTRTKHHEASVFFTKKGSSSGVRNDGIMRQRARCDDNEEVSSPRREFLVRSLTGTVSACLAASGSVFSSPAPAYAADEDMTAQLFNADGSLKEGNALGVTGEEAQFRGVEVSFPPDGSRYESVDGAKLDGSGNDGSVRIKYDLPQKWSEKGYIDSSDNVKACERIVVYQVPLTASSDKKGSILDKATTVGIVKTLQADITRFPELAGADLVGAKKRNESDDLTYYDFDLALAPKTCGKGGENLGLGFCPYDDIVILSATIMNDVMYVLQMECGKDEWKHSNSDLKRVRQSFAVQA